MQIRPLQAADLEKVQKFTDKTIGQNYFSLAELQDCFVKSQFEGITYSFVLVDPKNQIQGFRLAYPPGAWEKGKGAKLKPELWQVPRNKVGYFQSLFIAPEVQGHGYGPQLSECSITALKKIGTMAVVTHAWVESPNNSSIRYLEKFGFKKIALHPEYWIDVNYQCVRDGNPCRCTAQEMIKYL